MSKYHAQRHCGYASKREANVSANLHALAAAGKITNLREQVKFELVKGRNGVRGVSYYADFTWIEDGALHVADAKGYPTPAYALKKRLMYLLLGIEIEEL